MWLPVLLGLAVAFSVFMYVAMDGFDLGVGILFPFATNKADRALMMNSIAPFWDGNETWLVLGGTLLIAAFPLAYATLLPALYVPILTMLFALIFRGIAFEFRFRATRSRPAWDMAFSGGSQTTGTTADYGRAATRLALPAMLAFIAIVSIWTPLANPHIAQRWFSWPDIGLLSPVPIMTALVAYGIWRAIPGPREQLPFLLAIALFFLGFLGLGISLWPYAVPYSATLWEAASSPATLAFVGVGTAVILPVVLSYFAFAHLVFRGKTTADSGYGH